MDVENVQGTGIVRLLGSSNWDIWKFHVQLVLQNKDLMSVVTAEVANPDDDVGKEKKPPSAGAIQKDFAAQRIIGLSMYQYAAVQLLSCTSAREMWLKLHEVYELKNEMSAKKEEDEECL